MERPKPADDETFLTKPDESARASFGAAFERIVGIMARLRGPGGCPWDREQTLDTLKPYLIEEAYEVIEALEGGTPAHHKEELGDLLLQVIFQAELRRREGEFDAADVAHAIADKLVNRHPHVFAGLEAEGVAQAFLHWEKKKAEEKGRRSVIDGVPRHLPALLRAQRITEKASRVGFDWPDAAGPRQKLSEELEELRNAIEARDPAAIEHELGDVLFTVVNLSRQLGVSAEDALNGTINRFVERFKTVEATVKERGMTMEGTSLEILDTLWEEAKKAGEPDDL